METRLLTKSEIAAQLRISVRTLDHLMADGRIPYLKLRRSVRFAPDAAQRLFGPFNGTSAI